MTRKKSGILSALHSFLYKHVYKHVYHNIANKVNSLKLNLMILKCHCGYQAITYSLYVTVH